MWCDFQKAQMKNGAEEFGKQWDWHSIINFVPKHRNGQPVSRSNFFYTGCTSVPNINKLISQQIMKGIFQQFTVEKYLENLCFLLMLLTYRHTSWINENVQSNLHPGALASLIFEVIALSANYNFLLEGVSHWCLSKVLMCVFQWVSLFVYLSK